VVANSSTLQGLAVVSNALGIDATRSTIRDVTANSNAGAGIDAGEGSNVRSSTAAANQGNGILSVAYAVIADSAAFANGAIGISAANGNLVRGNVVAENATGVGSLLGDNRVEENHLLSNTCGFCEIGLGRSLLTKNSARVNTTDYAFGSSWSGGIWNSPIRTNCAGGPCVNETAPPWVNFALGD
jgi:hypothetical protein